MIVVRVILFARYRKYNDPGLLILVLEQIFLDKE